MTYMKQVTLIDCQDFDDLVTETYGKPYCFQQQDGCKERGTAYFTVPLQITEYSDFKNDSIPEIVNGNKMGISFKSWLERDPDLEIREECHPENKKCFTELFWHRNFYPNVEVLVQDLYNKGVLPAGDYVINIDW